MHGTAHRIRTQRWIVRTGSVDEAFAWRQLLHDQVLSVLTSAFETAFDEVSNERDIVRIPTIRLAVRIGPESPLPEGLLSLILRQLREQLPGVLASRANGRNGLADPAGFGPSGSGIGLLRRYLTSGCLPWFATGRPSAETAKELRETCRQEWRQVLNDLPHDRSAEEFCFRLLELLWPEEGVTLAEALSDHVPEELRAAAVESLKLLLDPQRTPLDRHTRFTLASALLADCFDTSPGENPSYLARRLGDLLPSATWHLLAGSGKVRSAGLPVKSPIPEAGRSVDPAGTGRFDRPSAEGNRIGLLEGSSLGNNKTDTDSGLLHFGGTKRGIIQLAPSAETGRSVPPYSDDLFPLWVNDAGIILLHPFLGGLFENTGITEGKDPTIPPSRLARAAALLRFVVAGNDAVMEYELPFVKILLGLHPESPLPVAEGLLGPRDSEEVETLLGAAVSYWAALGNTSIEGLRSSFLQRPGLLRDAEEGWKLTVERRAFDMLLDRLPWSISVIRLPWMKKAIYTQW
jgi:hypothetical protein